MSPKQIMRHTVKCLNSDLWTLSYHLTPVAFQNLNRSNCKFDPTISHISSVTNDRQAEIRGSEIQGKHEFLNTIITYQCIMLVNSLSSPSRSLRSSAVRFPRIRGANSNRESPALESKSFRIVCSCSRRKFSISRERTTTEMLANGS